MSADPNVPAPDPKADARPAASSWDGPLTWALMVVVVAVGTYLSFFVAD